MPHTRTWQETLNVGGAAIRTCGSDGALPASVPARPTRTPWLFGAPVDLAVFAGAPLLSIVAVAIAHAFGLRAAPTWVFLSCIVMVDVAHVHATAFRVYLDPSEVARRPVLYLGTPVLVYAAGAGLYVYGGAALFWRVLAYLAVWHFVRQQVGWVALYRRRFGESRDPTRRPDAWLDPAATYAAALYPILVWHAGLPRRFHWFVAGDFAAGTPAVAVDLARPAYVALLVLFIARQAHIALAMGWGAVNRGKVLVVLGTFATWWVGIVGFDDDFAFTVTNVLPHGIPYFALVAVYSARRYSDRSAPHAALASGILRLGWVVAYGALVALALFEEGLWDRWVWHDHTSLFGGAGTADLGRGVLPWVVPLLALPQAVHYVLDGAIWRAARNPSLAAYLFGDPPRSLRP